MSLISPFCLFFFFYLIYMFCSSHIFMDVCLILPIAHKILFIFFSYQVHMFSSIFSSWLTCLSLRFDYSLNFKICNKRLKTFFFKRTKKKKIRSVFSLNTDLEFFCIQNRSIFSLNTDLKFFSIQN